MAHTANIARHHSPRHKTGFVSMFSRTTPGTTWCSSSCIKTPLHSFIVWMCSGCTVLFFTGVFYTSFVNSDADCLHQQDVTDVSVLSPRSFIVYSMKIKLYQIINWKDSFIFDIWFTAVLLSASVFKSKLRIFWILWPSIDYF